MIKISLKETNLINDTLNNKGFIIIDNLLNDFAEDQIVKLARNTIKSINKEKFSLADEKLKETIVEKIRYSKEFIEFFSKLLPYKSLNKKHDIHYLLNYSSLNSKKNTKLSYHFDAFLITMIIPINLNEYDNKKIANKISIIPNLRKETRSFYLNLLYKLFFQNNIFRFFSNSKLFNYFFKSEEITLKYNQILLFNGFRSLHSAKILSSDIRSERIRLIYHISNPFVENILERLIFNKNQKDRNKKIKN